LIEQYLVEQGYTDVAELLMENTGVSLEEESVKSFKKDVLT
jgi:hypothetical protein